MRRIILLWIAILGIALALPANAHEEGIYESIGHIPIGRVFLSPGERDQLDTIRLTGPFRATDIGPRVAQPAKPKNDKAAGFIISDTGTARIWKDGDFIAVENPNVRFPGKVEVTRQENDSAQGDGAPDEDTPVAEAGDEQP